MKKIYSNSNRSLALLVILATAAFCITSCTDKFEEFNTDPYGISREQLKEDFNYVGLPFKQMQLSLYVNDPAWNTQLQQNLIGDVYSGYMTPPTPFNGNVNNMTYSLVAGWNGYPWSDGYDFVMKPAAQVKSLAENVYDDFYAWSLILKVEAMHRVSDIYGPIIYSKFGQTNPDGSVSYDSQKDVYYAFFEELDKAITLLTPYADKEETLKSLPFAPFDLVYSGSYTKWVRFANTLRLRLAIRISKIDPVKAKEEGEAALAHSLGILSTNDDNFVVSIPTTHPLNVINNTWGDIRLGAPVESILGGYEDPRISKYALPASDPAVAGEYKGIREGIDIDAKSRYQDYSKLVTFADEIQLMTAAEAWFLKAEAALRGWSGAGDAQTNYEKGVKTSFDQNAVGGYDDYITDNTKKAAPYTDPKAVTAGENDILAGSPYLSTVTIQWNDGDTFERSLERIITQKWIAMYPDGQEAWSEFRRTGYPKLFPVVKNYSGGKISTTDFIRRIEFASGEYSTNPSGVAGAIDLLGGPDTGGTRLWWDHP
ncbi:MAG TPA: RagB/SusD family nutrient uptake outer membrane protein [Ohtaekwangia sp.]|uniref:RagB/SusD family nutrient uptake outer membrane protein n=1 Tax=Ohtaekwangia sp. TaxID=2066019 RepID=UPI002F92238A